MNRNGWKDMAPRVLLGAAAIAVCTGMAYQPVLSLGHFGWDTYPMMLTSRVLAWSDVVGNLTEPLMDGRYPRGSFYRPVANFSLALDYSIWGIHAFGYHATDLMICIASALGVVAVGRRQLGLGAGAWIAALVFALHPVQLEVLPVVARRADALSLLFVLAALAVWPTRPRSANGWWSSRRLAVGIACALALGSKETGVIALPLLFVWTVAQGRGQPAQRLNDAARHCAVPAALVALVLAARFAVLGGIGGHGDSSLAESLLGIPQVLFDFADRVAIPQPLASSAGVDRVLAVAIAVGLVAAGLSHRRPGLGASARNLGLLAIWLVAVAGITALAGKPRSWYALAFLPAYALACGAVVEAAWGARSQIRSPAFAGLACLAIAMAGAGLRYSPAVHRYEEWQLLDARQTDFLERFDRAVSRTQPGAVAYVRGLPQLQPRLGRVGVREASGMALYGVEAYAELRFPDLAIRIASLDEGAPLRASEGQITIGISSR